ncbi:MAG: PHP-associated domain-containing protein [Candidatus ainarchaeum sp.]|nr:PHP-associated domain-containing protein [Candidatus ainarchaeum sp.]
MLFDLHTHSKYSIDALSKPETMLKICKKNNWGISITDHDNMNVYSRGNVKKIAKKLDVFLIPGEEIRVLENNGGDSKCVGEIIVYFLKEEIKPSTFKDILVEIKKQDALLSCPHPFDWPRKNFKDFKNNWKEFNSMEVYNARAYYAGLNKKSQFFFNTIFKEKKISALGVSDAHTPEEIGNGLTDISANNEEEFRRAIKKGNTKIIINNKAKIWHHIQTQLARKNMIKER